MADVRHTTELAIKTDPRDVGGLLKLMGKVFNPRMPAMFNRAMRETRGRLRDVNRETERIVTAMGRVREGTRTWKDLSQKLRQVNQEAKALETTMRRLGTTGGGSPGGGMGGRSMGQGRYGRGGQMATPGGGAIMHALQTIPYVGFAMGGAYLAAANTYSSFTSFQQAQQQAAPFLMGAGAASTFTPPPGLGRARSGGSLSAHQIMERYRADRQSTVAGSLRLGLERIASPLLGENEQGRTWMERSALKNAVGAFGPDAVTNSLRGAASRRRPSAFNTGTFTTVGQAYGIKPQEALGLASQLSQGMHAPAGGADLESALAARQMFGTSIEAMGGFRGTLARTGYGGKRSGDNDAVTRTLATAVRMGLEASEINEYLSQQTSFLRSMEQQGQNVSFPELMAAQEGMVGGGVRGFRAGQITSQIGQAGVQLGRGGMQSAAQVRLMRSLGYTGTGGRAEYAKYSLLAQDPGQAASAFPGMISTFLAEHQIDPNSDMGALMTQRLAGSLGVQLGASESRTFAAGAGGMRAGMNRSIAAGGSFRGEIEAESMRMMLGGGARGLAGVTAGTLVEQAGIEQQRVAVGGRVSEQMLNLERVTVQLGGAFTNALEPALVRATEGLDNFTNSLETGSRGMWGTSDPLGRR